MTKRYKKNQDFIRTEDYEKEFAKLKQIIWDDEVLTQLNLNSIFILETDEINAVPKV